MVPNYDELIETATETSNGPSRHSQMGQTDEEQWKDTERTDRHRTTLDEDNNGQKKKAAQGEQRQRKEIRSSGQSGQTTVEEKPVWPDKSGRTVGNSQSGNTERD